MDPGRTMQSLPSRGDHRPVIRLVRVLPVGGAQPQIVVLGRDSLVLGRHGEPGSLAFPDHEISRRHAEIRPDQSGWELVDLGSRNGTYVDGVRVERVHLADQAVVRMGGNLLMFIEEEARDEDSVVEPSPRILGGSAAVHRLLEQIGEIALHPVPVVVQGEAGVGKELVAQEIHRRSRRPGKLVTVRCAAIAGDLAELLESAQQGTLLLDDIDEMPAERQAELARALATRGDARIVAVTRGDLRALAEGDAFRADLYVRLAAYVIDIPPLRKRREDVLSIANAILEQRHAPPLSATAAEALLLQAWPGNVPELIAALERATAP